MICCIRKSHRGTKFGFIKGINLKCNKQSAKVIITNNRVTGMTKRTFSYFSRDIVLVVLQ